MSLKRDWRDSYQHDPFFGDHPYDYLRISHGLPDKSVLVQEFLNRSRALEGMYILYCKKDSRFILHHANGIHAYLELGGTLSGRNVAGWSVR